MYIDSANMQGLFCNRHKKTAFRQNTIRLKAECNCEGFLIKYSSPLHQPGTIRSSQHKKREPQSAALGCNARHYCFQVHGGHGNGGGGGSGTMGRGPGTGLGPGPGPGTKTGKHAVRTSKHASISSKNNQFFFMTNLLPENNPMEQNYYTRLAKSLHSPIR
jgi:hypothetical protein